MMHRKKLYVSSGVLTALMITQAATHAEQNAGRPSELYVMPGMIEKLIAWEKQERWLKSLLPIEEKMERLRIRLKNRRPDLSVMKLPE
jgi:hypothetical protein